MPKEWTKSKSIFTLSSRDIKLVSSIDCDVIQQAFNRFRLRLQDVTGSNDGAAQGQGQITSEGEIKDIHVNIQTEDCPRYPQLGVSEQYDLNITTVIYISAPEIWGALWAFETLGQLTFNLDSEWYVNQTFIRDEPRFAHRGLHLDTARHFYNVDILKTNLDAMAMNKLNVFHWHIVDAQSFPYNSTTFPELALKGAYSPDQVYSQSDVQEIINYAAQRGIRVLPEFDTPGHAQSWGKGYPGHKKSLEHPWDPSNYFGTHPYRQSSPIIQEFMAQLGIPPGEYSGLETYYSQRLLSLIRPMNKRVVIWEDPVNHGAQISNDTLIQVWKDKNSPPGSSDWQIHLNDAINKGFQVIFSSCWYLNLISYGQDWTKYYLCEPFNINASVEDLKNIIGGEACLWSEFIDESNLLSILWPRASAVAERLWSPAHVNDTQEATFRLDQHRCRMTRHGIPAKPLLPGYCREDYNTDNSWLLPSHKSHDESMTTIKPTTTKKSGNSSTRLNFNSFDCNMADGCMILKLDKSELLDALKNNDLCLIGECLSSSKESEIENSNARKEAIMTALLGEAIRKKRHDVVNFLIANGANASAVYEDKSQLSRAVQSADIDIIKSVSHSIEDITAFEPNGKSVLHEAAAHSGKEVIDLLVHLGSDIEAKDRVQGNTPMHVACIYCNRDAIMALFKHGAKINPVNDFSEMPLDKVLGVVKRNVDFHDKTRLELAKDLILLGFKISTTISRKHNKRISTRTASLMESSDIHQVYIGRTRDKNTSKCKQGYSQYHILVQSIRKTMNLQGLCRLTIIHCLDQRPLQASIGQLGIPTIMQNYLLKP
ncbi:hypothetical protein Btru_072909 [Bulinus truncatus]|nr:hypothetical protein Btru_072909 [Bulinus truncatus]